MRRLLVVLALLVPSAMAAQGWIVPRCGTPDTPDGRPGDRRRPLEQCGPAQVVRTGSTVTAELSGRVVHYEIEERFENRGATLGEADYYFPLPRTAAFQDLKLSIDGEMVAGETMSAEEARGIYEAIVRQQRDPALVEWMGHGLLRLRIFPFRAGEERKVVVRLQAVAGREGDAVRVDYARGARLGGTDRPLQRPMPAANVRDVPPSDSRESHAPVRFTLRYPVTAGYGRPYSPTHELDVSDRGGTRRVEAEGQGGDVTILLPIRRRDEASLTLLAHAPAREDGYALVTVTPPSQRPGGTTPRDLTFVVDVSGSMSGGKLQQAKAAGHQVLSALRASDRFRIVSFASDVQTFRDGFVPATPANVRAARRYIDALEAAGGTNISGALDEALRGTPDPRRLGLLLFLTDGAPTVGERDPARIAERAATLRRERRIFSFGVGADVNATLVEQLALEGRGTAHFVRPDESVEHAVSLVASRLADPVLTDVRISAEGARLSRMHPVQPLDLFAGQDLVVFARYAGSGRGRVVVEGTSLTGPVRWTQDVTFPARERANAFVSRLWATQRVGWLHAEKRREGGSAEHDAEIRQLGERFGIPTEFTSYLVVEPGMVAGNTAATGQVVLRGMVPGADMRRDAAGAPAASPAPAMPMSPATVQFEAARRDAKLREARTLDQAAQSLSGTVARHAMGRGFVLDSTGRWTDVNHAAGARVLSIAPFSPAYFALLREIPALQEAFALGERVLVAGKGLSVATAGDGRTSLTGMEVGEVRRALAIAGSP